MTSTETYHNLTAEDFGPSRNGVHLYQNENGNYLIFGHPSDEDLVEAIRLDAVAYDYLEEIPKSEEIIRLRRNSYLNEVVRDEETGEWVGKWCQPEDEGATAVAKVVF